jgi:hypothetical protein
MMRLLLDTSAVGFQVTRAAEARKDFGKDVQKVDRETGRPSGSWRSWPWTPSAGR